MHATAHHFDALDYVNQAKAFGVEDKLAQFQARQMEIVIKAAKEEIKEELQPEELATKADIARLETRLDTKIDGLVFIMKWNLGITAALVGGITITLLGALIKALWH